MDSFFSDVAPQEGMLGSTARVSPSPAAAASAASSPSAPRPSTKTNHSRSCVFCRRRKVKCDRQQPCSNCSRCRLECTYPVGRGRAAKKPRKTLDGQLVDRLHRLESIIKSLTSQEDLRNTDTDAQSVPAADPRPLTVVETAAKSTPDDQLTADNTSPSSVSSHSRHVPVEQQLGRLVIDETRSSYVSNILWASLGNEVEELRDMLLESRSDDEGYSYASTEPADPADTPMPEMASPLGSSMAILGFRSLSHSLLAFHPPLPQSISLLTVFTENVLPLVHIFHMPTTRQMYWDASVSLDSLSKNSEALLFAIYYAAVISMDDSQCMSVLGVMRASALDKYRFAVEQAFARANLLNTQSLILLQAAVVFLSALRNEDDSRTAWALTSLVFHIAQAMGLHRDGHAFGLKALDIELRRRLWWHICLLDMRSAEFHGYEPIVNESSFDTRLPLNVNDSDLTPLMTDPPAEAVGITEMTFCLIRCEAMRAGWKVSYAPPRAVAQGMLAEDSGLKDREDIVEALKQRLEERYLQYCDPCVPFMLLSSTVARLIIARIWLVVHYPTRQKPVPYPASNDIALRDRLFATSIEVLEQSVLLLTNKDIFKWTWHSRTHIQWHAVIFVLSEICSRPPSAQCDHAWECVNTVHDRWNMKKDGKKGYLWRPIKRLLAKARYVREMQKIDPGVYTRLPITPTIATTLALSPDNNHPSKASSVNETVAHELELNPISNSNLITRFTSAGAMGMPCPTYPAIDNLQDVLGIESPHELIGLSSNYFEAEMFDTMIYGPPCQWDEQME